MKNKTTIVASVIGVLALIVILNSVYFVREGEYAVIKRFEQVIRIHGEAGLGLKVPFLEGRDSLPKRYIHYNLAPTDVITLDKKSMIVDTYALWQIVDPLHFLQTAGTTFEAERRLEASIYGYLKSTIGSINQVDIIESRTNKGLNAIVLERAAPALEAYGVRLVDVQIKRFDLPSSNKNAVFERMISERNQIVATYLAEGEEEANRIRYTADKEKEIIVSEAKARGAELEGLGEREYMRILAEAFNSRERASFYEFLRTLDALKITMRGDKTLILNDESALVRMINGKDFATK